MKGMNESLWEKMKDGNKVMACETGEIAVRKAGCLCWIGSGDQVSTDTIITQIWQLIAEEEKEIGTERWEQSSAGRYPDCVEYRDTHGYHHGPSAVMERKNFLRWVGTTVAGERWPENSWYIWLHERESLWWSRVYRPGDGYRKQVLANYAEMRVEK